ncbi:MAG: iron-containing alcohol dehydrogenase [Spirochaetales bacterium]|nr:MAG: iron-containing alcohol dehydrogenase [Spirochaetales bacterium]
MQPFTFYRTPEIIFGTESFFSLPDILAKKGIKRIILLTGKISFTTSEYWRSLTAGLPRKGIEYRHYTASGEPSPLRIDEICGENRGSLPDAVVAVGGGSVLDAGKAVSAMLKTPGNTEDYLESVGTKTPPGIKIPFIAVPTTAGTGTEASKNAVLSKPGPGGYKKSLRHDNYAPDLALVDPILTLSCPRDLTAAVGLDALTQLLEAFVSVKASLLSDASAASGLIAVGRSLVKAVEDGEDLEARSGMAYAALMSGVAMANAGLGLVHGLASPLGGGFPITHSVVCGTLLAETTAAIVNRLFDHEEENNTALLKYAEAGKYLSGQDAGGLEDNCEQLLNLIDTWTEDFSMPRLGSFGIKETALSSLAAKTGHKESHAILTIPEIEEILKARI